MRTIVERKKNLNKEVRRISRIVIKKYSPEKIILFGSLAVGNIHEWSDIDLVIIMDTQERFIQRLHDIRMLVQPNESVDFIVYTPKEVEKMLKEQRLFFIEEILNKGKVLYEK